MAGRINTLRKFQFTYGKIMIRAKLPSEEWVFPELFLEPVENSYGSGKYESGQMRIAFIKGNTGLLSGGVILAQKEPNRSERMCTNSNPDNIKWDNDYHIYTLEWTPGK